MCTDVVFKLSVTASLCEREETLGVPVFLGREHPGRGAHNML